MSFKLCSCFNDSMTALAINRQARFDHEILDRYEAGIVLFGHEVKAVKNGNMALAGSFVSISKGEAWLVSATIPPYQTNNTPEGYDPKRPRKLLLKRSEIEELVVRSSEKGLTLVPLRVYTQKAKVKLEFALAKGKKKADKRETLKKRDAEREMRAHHKYL